MSPTSERRQGKRWPGLAAALAFTLAAGLLRLSFLEKQALWNDEMFSFDVANLPLGAIQTRLLAYYHHPPLFFYALHAALALFGQSAWALRLVPACIGALTVGLVYLVAERIYGKAAALLAAGICCVAPFHLAYSQEGRPYAMAAFFCLLSLYAMLMVIGDGRRSWKVTYAVSTALLLYTHHWGVFVVLAQMTFILLDRSISRGVRRSMAGLWGIVGLSYLPEAVAVALSLVAGGGGSPLAEWVVPPSSLELVDLGRAFSGGYFQMASSVFTMPWPVQVIAGLALVGLVAVLVRRAFSHPGDGALRAMLLTIGVTILVPYAVSFWVPKLFLWYRYPVIVFPVFCVCAGAVASGATKRSVPLLFAAALLAVGVGGTVKYFSWSKSNVREVAAYVQEATKDSVRMIIRPRSFAFLLNYYYQGNAVQLDETYLDEPLGEIVDTAASFVYVSLDIPNEIRDYMDGHFDKIGERRFPGEAHLGMVVGVYAQRPEPDEEEDDEEGASPP